MRTREPVSIQTVVYGLSLDELDKRATEFLDKFFGPIPYDYELDVKTIYGSEPFQFRADITGNESTNYAND